MTRSCPQCDGTHWIEAPPLHSHVNGKDVPTYTQVTKCRCHPTYQPPTPPPDNQLFNP